MPVLRYGDAETSELSDAMTTMPQLATFSLKNEYVVWPVTPVPLPHAAMG